MKDHNFMRERLIEGAIDVVNEFGIEKCTSKRVALSSEMNEAYIFRYYSNLIELRIKAFLVTVKKLAAGILIFLPSPEAVTESDMKKAVEKAVSLHEKEIHRQTVYFIRYLVSTEYTEEIHREATGIFESIIAKRTVSGGAVYSRDISGRDFSGGTVSGRDFSGGTVFGRDFSGGTVFGRDFSARDFYGGDFSGSDVSDRTIPAVKLPENGTSPEELYRFFVSEIFNMFLDSGSLCAGLN